MITLDLVAYIQAQLRKNISKETITLRLKDAGWHSDDIEEAFIKIAPPVELTIDKPTPQTSAPVLTQTLRREGADPYREPPDSSEPKAMQQESWSPRRDEAPKAQPLYKVPEQEKPTEVPLKPVFSQSFSEANPNYKKIYVEPKKDLPVSPPISATPISIVSETNENQLEVRSEELLPTLKPKIAPEILSTNPPIVRTPVAPIASTTIRPLAPTPPAIPKTSTIPRNFSSLKDIRITPRTPTFTLPTTPQNETVDSLPKGAILHSYQQVLSEASKTNGELFRRKRNVLFIWLVVILIISVIGGALFAVSENYINFPSLHLSFVKKDPKVLLLNFPVMLGKLKSYKTETVASLSMPAFADVTSGLVSGQPVTNHDKDSISMSAKGVVNNNPPSTTFDYTAIVKSSLFKNNIVTDIKYNNGTSFVTTPDLAQLLGSNAPPSKTVTVPRGELGSFVILFPTSIQDKTKNINLDKLVSIGLPSYINDEITVMLKDFVNNVNIIEKPSEDIYGVPTYHYELNADQQTTKKLLSQFFKVFVSGLTPEDQTSIDEKLGAVNMDSFEIWIGKDDSNIHQYKFSLTAPLSKVIGLDDKGIAGNTVNLSWQTSYYDFDVANDIVLPRDTIKVSDFIKSANDMKIKDAISSFKSAADSLHNALGNYGNRSNSTGSCTNPNPSSLFSPVGHAKGANVAVGNIAGIINNLLNTTNGALSCYSTSLAWAMSAPLESDQTSSFCADSTGAIKITKIPLNGTTCN